MLFNSIEFILFFSVTTAVYFLIPLKFQKYFLILCSCAFYAYLVPWHLLILAAIITVNYLFGRVVENAGSRKLYLVLIITLNLLVLSLFKYLGFLNSNIAAFAHFIGWNYSVTLLQLAAPMGISFYTFKCLSYNIEVYRKNIPVEKRFEIFSLYILIFPELLAGPIDRPQSIIPQLESGYTFDHDRIVNGLKLMAWGFFQKWVIADRLAVFVNKVYDNVHAFNGLSFAVATFFFALQLYCDFSAYSDIAIGAGEVLGFKFMKNFNRPYFSTSISEFWRRWHISLSTWLRDYLYTPIAIATRRWGAMSVVFSLFVTFVLAGVWHGAGMTFVVFGALHGAALSYEFISRNFRKKLTKALPSFIYDKICILITFSYVCLTFVFFRANNINDAFYMIKQIYAGFYGYRNVLLTNIVKFNFSEIIKPLSLGLSSMDFYLTVFFISVLFAVQLFQKKRGIRDYISQKPLVVRWTLYLALIFIILIYGKFETRQFIYIQF